MAAIRTFIAVTVDSVMTARLERVQCHLREVNAPIAWVRPEGMHLTMKFLGDVAEERLSALDAALAPVAAEHRSFSLSMEGIGAFPDLRNPRVIWAGIGAGAAELITLAGAIDETLAVLGFPRETRPFHPHLTLGRVKGPMGLAPLISRMEMHAGEHFGVMRADAFTLYRSDLSSQGARYTILRQFPLALSIIE